MELIIGRRNNTTGLTPIRGRLDDISTAVLTAALNTFTTPAHTTAPITVSTNTSGTKGGKTSNADEATDGGPGDNNDDMTGDETGDDDSETGNETGNDDSETGNDDDTLGNAGEVKEAPDAGSDRTDNARKDSSDISGDVPPDPSAIPDDVPPDRSDISGDVPPDRSAISGDVPPDRSAIPGDVSPDRSAIPGDVSPDRSAIPGDVSPDRSDIPYEDPRDRSAAPDLPGDLPDPRSFATRMAHALIEALHTLLNTAVLPTNGGQRPHISVVMTFDQMKQQIHSAKLSTGAHLTPAQARQLLCDASITPAVLNGTSEILDLGRTRRTFTTAIRKALTLRDGGCAWPHCDRPPQWTDAHHINWWFRDLGETSLNNGRPAMQTTSHGNP